MTSCLSALLEINEATEDFVEYNKCGMPSAVDSLLGLSLKLELLP